MCSEGYDSDLHVARQTLHWFSYILPTLLSFEMLILIYTASPILLGGQLCPTFRSYSLLTFSSLFSILFFRKNPLWTSILTCPTTFAAVHNSCHATAEFSALVAVCFSSRPCTHPTTYTPKSAFCWILSTSLLGFLMLSLVYMNITTMTIFTSCYTLTQTSAIPISRFCCLLFLHILFMMPYLIPLVIYDSKAMCYILFAIEITKVWDSLFLQSQLPLVSGHFGRALGSIS